MGGGSFSDGVGARSGGAGDLIVRMGVLLGWCCLGESERRTRKFGREIYFFNIFKVVDDLSAPCRQPTTGPESSYWTGARPLGQGRFFMLFWGGETRARGADFSFLRNISTFVERSIFAC